MFISWNGKTPKEWIFLGFCIFQEEKLKISCAKSRIFFNISVLTSKSKIRLLLKYIFVKIQHTFAVGCATWPESGVEALPGGVADQHVSLGARVGDRLADSVIAAGDCCVELAVGTTTSGRLWKLEQWKQRPEGIKYTRAYLLSGFKRDNCGFSLKTWLIHTKKL